MALFTAAYRDLLGNSQAREHTIDLDFLQLERFDLSDLEQVFTEQEIWEVIKSMPTDRAPGPDGFTGAFFIRAWPIIKVDLIACIHSFMLGNGRGVGRLNRL